MKKYIGQRLAQVLLLLSLTVIISGCTLGLRKSTKIVYGNIAAPIGQGAVRIATNDQITVTVDAEVSTMDLGGYYVLSSGDMKLFIKLLKDQK
jgi:hypothetical protein